MSKIRLLILLLISFIFLDAQVTVSYLIKWVIRSIHWWGYDGLVLSNKLRSYLIASIF